MSIINDILMDRARLAADYWSKGDVAPDFELVCGISAFVTMCDDPASKKRLIYTQKGHYVVDDLKVRLDDDADGWQIQVRRPCERKPQ